ncbi:MAG: hypothetical protein PHW24_04860 [Candidatus Moranbacteria bacterium]|nr:hypothetical protein [Candidatus Moranbacteria bacterium]
MKKVFAKINLMVALVALVAIGGIFVATAMVKAFADNKPVTITATILETLTLACNNATIPNLTAGTPQSVQATCTVTTNGQNGFNLKVNKTTVGNDATKTLKHSDGTTWITDTGSGLAAFDGTTATPVLWGTAKGLGFRVGVVSTTPNANSLNPPAGYAMWGNDGATAEYAAFPVTAQTIYNYASYASAASTISIEYKLDVPTTQKSGAYTGTVQYTATTN